MNRLYLLLAVGLVILLLLPLFLDNYALGIFVMIFYWAYVGQSWNVLTGYTGHISLGHALYIGIGAYTTTYLAQTFGLNPGSACSSAESWPSASPLFSDF